MKIISLMPWKLYVLVSRRSHKEVWLGLHYQNILVGVKLWFWLNIEKINTSSHISLLIFSAFNQDDDLSLKFQNKWNMFLVRVTDHLFIHSWILFFLCCLIINCNPSGIRFLPKCICCCKLLVNWFYGYRVALQIFTLLSFVFTERSMFTC